MKNTLLIPLLLLLPLILSCKNSELQPSKILLEVPFSPQAPHANWDDPYQEACEEMALIMGHYFLIGEELTPEIADKEILDLVKWEEENGYAEDVTLEELMMIGCEYYKDCTNFVINQVTPERIKEELLKGNPIIVPAAGRTLGNPYFSGEGPWYHMLVIKGFNEPLIGTPYFITNDPGTKRGNGYKYGYEVLINAIHDWAGTKENIESGKKKMMVIQRVTGH